MTRAIVTGGLIPGQSGVTLLGRVCGSDGVVLTRAAVGSVAYTVSNLTTGKTLGTGALSVASVFFDSLQVDARWEPDTIGYNFALVLAASLFAARTLTAESPLAGPDRPHRVQCDVSITPATGETFRLLYAWQQQPTYGS